MIKPRLFLTPGAVLYVGPGIRAARHRHYAPQLCWGLDAPLRVELDGATLSARAVIIPSEVAHAFESGAGRPSR